jgi:hypothetical protein
MIHRDAIEAGLLAITQDPDAPAAAKVSAWATLARMAGLYEPDSQPTPAHTVRVILTGPEGADHE